MTFCLLDKHLVDKTYLVGEQVTVADLAILLLLGKSKFAVSATVPNTSRWFELTSGSVTLPISIPITFVAGISNAPTAGAATASAAGGKKAAAASTTAATNDNIAVDEGGTCPPLFEAIDGQVCTRFPPEPSGYLHIGTHTTFSHL
jgi:glutamyl-tRNA synthetase